VCTTRLLRLGRLASALHAPHLPLHSERKTSASRVHPKRGQHSPLGRDGAAGSWHRMGCPSGSVSESAHGRARLAKASPLEQRGVHVLVVTVQQYICIAQKSAAAPQERAGEAHLRTKRTNPSYGMRGQLSGVVKLRAGSPIHNEDIPRQTGGAQCTAVPPACGTVCASTSGATSAQQHTDVARRVTLRAWTSPALSSIATSRPVGGKPQTVFSLRRRFAGG
jgi:hypothetical protein